MDEFVPAPYYVVESSEQIKAFADPLRIRILGILRESAATIRQIVELLGESYSKVQPHLRCLLDAKLVVEVNSMSSDDSAEKCYRAVARLFDIRPMPGDVERDVALIKPVLDRVRSEVLASVMLFPAATTYFHVRAGSLTPERVAEFNRRFVALLAEFWGEQADEPEGEAMRMGFFTYRDPGDLLH